MVVSWLKRSGSRNCSPGENSSRRMPTAISPPIENMTKLNHRYSVPMSLWLVVVIHRMTPPYGP